MELAVKPSLQQTVDDARDAVDFCMGAVHLAIEKILVAGRALIVAKSTLNHGEWHDYLAIHCPQLHPNTAARWMKLSHLSNGIDLDSAANVTQAYRLAGILPLLETGDATGRAYGAASFITHLVQASNQLNARISNCPVAQWSPQDRAILKQRIQPLAELYDTL